MRISSPQFLFSSFFFFSWRISFTCFCFCFPPNTLRWMNRGAIWSDLTRHFLYFNQSQIQEGNKGSLAWGWLLKKSKSECLFGVTMIISCEVFLAYAFFLKKHVGLGNCLSLDGSITCPNNLVCFSCFLCFLSLSTSGPWFPLESAHSSHTRQLPLGPPLPLPGACPVEGAQNSIM